MLYKRTAKQVIKRDEGAEGEKYISINNAFVVEPTGHDWAERTDAHILVTHRLLAHLDWFLPCRRRH